MNCTRCDGTGFLNIHQVPDEIASGGPEKVLAWLDNTTLLIVGDCQCAVSAQLAPCARCESHHDVQVCDCCGDGEQWHGEPGRHYDGDDIPGEWGPYAYNGGFCECQ